MFLEPYVKIIMLQKTCSLCGSKFDCTENETCWCFKETRIIENEIKYDECICKECLSQQYRKKLLGIYRILPRSKFYKQTL